MVYKQGLKGDTVKLNMYPRTTLISTRKTTEEILGTRLAGAGLNLLRFSILLSVVLISHNLVSFLELLIHRKEIFRI